MAAAAVCLDDACSSCRLPCLLMALVAALGLWHAVTVRGVGTGLGAACGLERVRCPGVVWVSGMVYRCVSVRRKQDRCSHLTSLSSVLPSTHAGLSVLQVCPASPCQPPPRSCSSCHCRTTHFCSSCHYSCLVQPSRSCRQCCLHPRWQSLQ